MAVRNWIGSAGSARLASPCAVIPAGQPFVSAVCSALFLAKHINLGEILGGVLIIIGLLSVVASRVWTRGPCPRLGLTFSNPNGRAARVAASPV